MKKNLVNIIFFELFFCNLFSQEELNIKNFAKLNDSVYIYKYEVSNKLYSDFLKSNEFDKSKIKIDTAQWLKKNIILWCMLPIIIINLRIKIFPL